MGYFEHHQKLLNLHTFFSKFASFKMKTLFTMCAIHSFFLLIYC